MDESSEKNLGERASQQGEDPQMPGKEAIEEPQSAAGNAEEHKLPVVWSPKLDAGEEAAEQAQAGAHEEISSSADEAGKEEPGAAAAAAAALPRAPRFVLLAASVALTAALGSFVGSLSASGIAHLWPSTAATPGVAAPARKAELAELALLKANLEGATRGANSQFAKLADRLDRIERAEIEPAAKIAHIADAVDRLEKRTAAAAASPAPETTGSIASNPPASEAKQPDKVLRDWIVHDVRGNRALIENRYGGVFAVMAGNVLPGLGRVETIKRRDGGWVVVTEHGIISSEP
jgi:hypothetical protein